MTTVYDTFAAVARRTPDADFLFTDSETAKVYGIEAGAIGYGSALARIDALKTRYAAAGYGVGHRAGLLLENRPAFFMHWFALNALGVSVVPINNDMRSAELAYLVEHSELCLAIVLPERAADVAAAAPAGATLVVVGPDDRQPLPKAPVPRGRAEPVASGAIAGGTQADAAPAIEGNCDAPPTAIDGRTDCALLYTSGTTGRPKGCVLANDYFVGAGWRYATLGGLCELRPGQERLITPLPMTHMNAMACSSMAMIVTGGCLVQVDRFHPRTWWQSVRESRATIIHYLGVMPAMLLGAPATDHDRLDGVRFGFGAGIDKRQHAVFEQRFGFPLLEAWAMTETGMGAVIIANRPPRNVGTASLGRPDPSVELRLVGDDGCDVPTGEPGELWVRRAGADPHEGFFTEYLKDPAATAEAWADGWFHTGDLVRRDELGNVYFVDRKKNVIRRSGENISAVEVESVLAQHPRVKAVAVAATPDEVRGDEVLACVVLHEGAPSEDRATIATQLTQLALDQLAYYKAPGYVAFMDALPLTVSQKVQRGQLKELAKALPGRPDCIDTRSMKKRQA